jgi:hypothetical protein
LLVVLGVSAAIFVFSITATLGEMTKTIYVLPFGLSSVLTFLVADRSLQRRFVPTFMTYINFAVYVNVGIVVETPEAAPFGELAKSLMLPSSFSAML